MYGIRVGILGTGTRGLQLYKNIQRFKTGIEVVALCDTNEQRLKNFAKMVGFRKSLYTDSALFLAPNHDVNAVIIATPDNTHGQFALQATQTKRHTLCEKPLAHSLEAAIRILRSTIENRIVFEVGYVLRYSNFYQTVKRYLDEGLIGQIRLVTALDSIRGAKYFRRWHRHSRISRGILLHKSVHTFDLLAWFLGNTPSYVTVLGRSKVFVPFDHKERRCRSCTIAETCRFHFDIHSSPYRELYLETEGGSDADVRDICVFNSEKDIIDHATVMFEFPDSLVNYTLSLFSPQSTRRFIFIGDQGELECDEARQRVEIRQFDCAPRTEQVRVLNDSKHGGGDYSLLKAFSDRIMVGDYANIEMVEGLSGLAMAIKAEEALRYPGTHLEIPSISSLLPPIFDNLAERAHTKLGGQDLTGLQAA